MGRSQSLNTRQFLKFKKGKGDFEISTFGTESGGETDRDRKRGERRQGCEDKVNEIKSNGEKNRPNKNGQCNL